MSQISIKPGYRPQSEDKTPLADAIDFYRLWQLTNSQRLQMDASLTRWAKAVSLRGMRNACPETYSERFAQLVGYIRIFEIYIRCNKKEAFILELISSDIQNLSRILKVLGKGQFDSIWQEITGNKCPEVIHLAIQTTSKGNEE